MTFEEYIHRLQGKRVAVIGIGVSNVPLIKLFLRKGIAVTACGSKDARRLWRCGTFAQNWRRWGRS